MVTAMNDFLTVVEAAVLVNRSKDSVYAWIRQGKLRAHKDSLGRSFVVAKDVLRVEADQKRGRPHGSPSLKGKL